MNISFARIARRVQKAVDNLAYDPPPEALTISAPRPIREDVYAILDDLLETHAKRQELANEVARMSELIDDNNKMIRFLTGMQILSQARQKGEFLNFLEVEMPRTRNRQALCQQMAAIFDELMCTPESSQR